MSWLWGKPSGVKLLHWVFKQWMLNASDLMKKFPHISLISLITWLLITRLVDLYMGQVGPWTGIRLAHCVMFRWSDWCKLTKFHCILPARDWWKVLVSSPAKPISGKQGLHHFIFHTRLKWAHQGVFSLLCLSAFQCLKEWLIMDANGGQWCLMGYRGQPLEPYPLYTPQPWTQTLFKTAHFPRTAT